MKTIRPLQVIDSFELRSEGSNTSTDSIAVNLQRSRSLPRAFHIYLPLLKAKQAEESSSNRIRIGERYQAIVPDQQSEFILTDAAGQLVWDYNGLSSDSVDYFIERVQDLMDEDMGVCEDALHLLHQQQYDVDATLAMLKEDPSILYPPDDHWNEIEELFFNSLNRKRKLRKDFHNVRQMMGSKSTRDVVQFYYNVYKKERKGSS
ncbi:hypothetical protein PROFUN_07617 [Planoprotostelium fungivorum]|uniref:ELM2 domain-containing protein n=1 Tax=Planoprotostelium fungivorum TaxID=1890364 RepID=A0A2P6NK56_9EUKA|nr:hypothetical protein PROFUN_07617 [Planoprotostelium fungivorum]